jgi:hypothetical protein
MATMAIANATAMRMARIWRSVVADRRHPHFR